jgi:hypothetical protein
MRAQVRDIPVRKDKIERRGENVSDVKGVGEQPLAGPHFKKNMYTPGI